MAPAQSGLMALPPVLLRHILEYSFSRPFAHRSLIGLCPPPIKDGMDLKALSCVNRSLREQAILLSFHVLDVFARLRPKPRDWFGDVTPEARAAVQYEHSLLGNVSPADVFCLPQDPQNLGKVVSKRSPISILHSSGRYPLDIHIHLTQPYLAVLESRLEMEFASAMAPLGALLEIHAWYPFDWIRSDDDHDLSRYFLGLRILHLKMVPSWLPMSLNGGPSARFCSTGTRVEKMSIELDWTLEIAKGSLDGLQVPNLRSVAAALGASQIEALDQLPAANLRKWFQTLPVLEYVAFIFPVPSSDRSEPASDDEGRKFLKSLRSFVSILVQTANSLRRVDVLFVNPDHQVPGFLYWTVQSRMGLNRALTGSGAATCSEEVMWEEDIEVMDPRSSTVAMKWIIGVW